MAARTHAQRGGQVENIMPSRRIGWTTEAQNKRDTYSMYGGRPQVSSIVFISIVQRPGTPHHSNTTTTPQLHPVATVLTIFPKLYQPEKSQPKYRRFFFSFFRMWPWAAYFLNGPNVAASIAPTLIRHWFFPLQMPSLFTVPPGTHAQGRI